MASSCTDQAARASPGSGITDPIAAVLVAALATAERVELWRGQDDDCYAPIGVTERGGEPPTTMVLLVATRAASTGSAYVLGLASGGAELPHGSWHCASLQARTGCGTRSAEMALTRYASLIVDAVRLRDRGSLSR
jgi:hypothetical protein